MLRPKSQETYRMDSRSASNCKQHYSTILLYCVHCLERPSQNDLYVLSGGTLNLIHSILFLWQYLMVNENRSEEDSSVCQNINSSTDKECAVIDLYKLN